MPLRGGRLRCWQMWWRPEDTPYCKCQDWSLGALFLKPWSLGIRVKGNWLSAVSATDSYKVFTLEYIASRLACTCKYVCCSIKHYFEIHKWKSKPTVKKNKSFSPQPWLPVTLPRCNQFLGYLSRDIFFCPLLCTLLLSLKDHIL